MTDPVEFLDLDDVIELARRLLGDPPPIRDAGLRKVTWVKKYVA